MTQFGGVLFASFVNNKFDSSPKQWRMLSACALECSSFIEMCTLLCPQYFLLLASVANIGKVVRSCFAGLTLQCPSRCHNRQKYKLLVGVRLACRDP
jgi:hypothetical protein